jgi:hypothetical protein
VSTTAMRLVVLIMENEIWKPIKGFEKLYHVSNTGKIKSLDRITKHSDGKTIFYKGKELNQTTTTHGYKSVMFSDGKIRKRSLVHRLIALSFIPNPENKPQINHISGIRSDNRIENLEWCTNKENSIHSFKIDLAVHGERTCTAKLNEAQVLEIRRKRLEENTPLKILSNEYNICIQQISRIIRNERWNHIKNK